MRSKWRIKTKSENWRWIVRFWPTTWLKNDKNKQIPCPANKDTENQIVYVWLLYSSEMGINNARLLHSKHFKWLPKIVISNVKHRRQATQESVAHGLPFVLMIFVKCACARCVAFASKWVIHLHKIAECCFFGGINARHVAIVSPFDFLCLWSLFCRCRHCCCCCRVVLQTRHGAEKCTKPQYYTRKIKFWNVGPRHFSPHLIIGMSCVYTFHSLHQLKRLFCFGGAAAQREKKVNFKWLHFGGIEKAITAKIWPVYRSIWLKLLG